MRLREILTDEVELTKDQADRLVESLLVEEDGVVFTSDSPPVQPPAPSEPAPSPAPSPDHEHHGRPSMNLWMRTFQSQLYWLFTATNIAKRLKELGIKGEGARRIKNAIKLAKKQIALMLANPGWLQYHWTLTGGRSTDMVSQANRLVKSTLQKELNKVK